MSVAEATPLERYLPDTQTGFQAHPLECQMTPCFFTISEKLPLYAMFAGKYSYFIESSAKPYILQDVRTLQHDAPDFAVSLTSRHAYQPEVVKQLCLAMNDRFGMNSKHMSDIQTCLQEAMVNAVAHGNFCIERSCESLDEFTLYYEKLEACLNNKDMREMRVTLKAWDYGRWLKIGIRHEGKGIIPAKAITDAHPAISRKSGRGLMIIHTLAQQVWSDDSGKSLYLSFNH